MDTVMLTSNNVVLSFEIVCLLFCPTTLKAVVGVALLVHDYAWSSNWDGAVLHLFKRHRLQGSTFSLEVCSYVSLHQNNVYFPVSFFTYCFSVETNGRMIHIKRCTQVAPRDTPMFSIRQDFSSHTTKIRAVFIVPIFWKNVWSIDHEYWVRGYTLDCSHVWDGLLDVEHTWQIVFRDERVWSELCSRSKWREIKSGFEFRKAVQFAKRWICLEISKQTRVLLERFVDDPDFWTAKRGSAGALETWVQEKKTKRVVFLCECNVGGLSKKVNSQRGWDLLHAVSALITDCTQSHLIQADQTAFYDFRKLRNATLINQLYKTCIDQTGT